MEGELSPGQHEAGLFLRICIGTDRCTQPGRKSGRELIDVRREARIGFVQVRELCMHRW